ncbi:hypothetical protein MLD38_016189 [Melastoma candidum]|uniref:Uncharacterized protein n=1 Tax=Melastoma candidum TaxID=119954 RepID=A0ACB9RMU9_9MYRT|nr:hypothetical protein MLD38_016189 [Melastoma candidum]
MCLSPPMPLLTLLLCHLFTLAADIRSYLYPFLSSLEKAKLLEQLRFAALGVIGYLVKVVINVYSTELRTRSYSLSSARRNHAKCLRRIAIGSDLSRTIATFIIQRIASDELGLSLICDLPERFYAVHCTLE